jgi:aminoglycoside 6'-N-acetyltransferase
VARWWREPSDLAAVEAAYGPLIDGSDPTEGFIAIHAGQGPGQEPPLAFLQRYRLDDNPEWQRAIALEGAAFLRTWAGVLGSDDPSDQSPHYLYERRRPPG